MNTQCLLGLDVCECPPNMASYLGNHTFSATGVIMNGAAALGTSGIVVLVGLMLANDQLIAPIR
jgi:hypothetical protein